MRLVRTYNRHMIFIPPIEVATRTDTGRVRMQNEDAVAASAEHGYAILADGMGGYRAGEVASLMAVGALEAAFQEGICRLNSEQSKSPSEHGQQVFELMLTSIRNANADIVKVSREEPECEGMGTTLVAAVVHDDAITIAHVGDSRAYRWRSGVLDQITRDHSLLQEQVDAGLISAEDARQSVNRNLVTRAVGIDLALEAEIHSHHVLPGDVYLLCSDGLSDMVDDAEIGDILAAESASLNDTCNVLVSRANERGGSDNISVILMRMLPQQTEPPTLLERVLNWLG